MDEGEKNEDCKEKRNRELGREMSHPKVLTCIRHWRGGDDWLHALHSYVKSKVLHRQSINRNSVHAFSHEKCETPAITVRKPLEFSEHVDEDEIKTEKREQK